MRIVQTASDLAPHAGGVFVPTMGALHEGHAALIRRAATVRLEEGIAGPVVVSIFVNPTQFNDPADLARYPRTPESDAAVCEAAGCEVLFVPPRDEVYPPGRVVAVPALPPAATLPGLEDAHRPGHFAGVCQVVRRLFEMARPAAAVFGEKDWQQLQVIDAMTRQERLGVRIVPCPTVREADGLAMSSRNRFLAAGERARALAIRRALVGAREEPTPGAAESRMRRALETADLDVAYAVVRDATTLLPPERATGLRALIAARCGSVRLIDNDAWPG